MLTGLQRAAVVVAALPRLSFKQVSAERTVVTIKKERINFMGLVSVVVVVAAVAFFVRVPSCMIRDYVEKRFVHIALGGLRCLLFCAGFRGIFKEFGNVVPKPLARDTARRAA